MKLLTRKTGVWMMIIGIAIFAVIILVASNTVSMQSLIPQGLIPQATPKAPRSPPYWPDIRAPTKPIITFDKTSYSEGGTVILTMVSEINKKNTIKPASISTFRVGISSNALGVFFPAITVKATKVAGKENTYTGTAKFTIPKVGTITTMTISVNAVDMAGRYSPTTTKIISRAKTFTVLK